MDLKRQLSVALIFGAGAGLIGCKSPGGGLAFWNRGNSTSVASAAPDVGEQKYAGLQQDYSGSRPMGQAAPGTTGFGGQKPPADENFITSSWKSTTGAIAGAFASTKTASTIDTAPADSLRLDAPSKKIGPEVYTRAAQILENQNNAAEAQAQYEKALAIAPKDFNALVGLARLHDREGQHVKAQEVYARAIKAHPTNALAYNDLGLSYARQRQHDRALGSLSKAVELAPDNAKYRNNLATVLVEAGRPDDAIAQLSVTNSPAVAHYNVGYLLLKKGDSPRAAQHFQQALSLDPGMAPARQMLAQAMGTPSAQMASAQGTPGYGAATAEPAETAAPGPTSGSSSATISDQPAAGGTPAAFASSSSTVTSPTIVEPESGGYRISDDEPSPAAGGYYDQTGGASRLPPE